MSEQEETQQTRLAPGDQENRPLPKSTKSRIPLLRARPPLNRLPQSTACRAMRKGDDEKRTPGPPEDVNTPSVSSQPRDQRPKSKVKTVPNFKKLHVKWEKKLEMGKASRRKTKKTPTAVTPLTLINNQSIPHVHSCTPIRRQDSVRLLANTLFEKIAQTTGRSIRVMSKIPDSDVLGLEDIKISLDKQLSEVADHSKDLPESICPQGIPSVLGNSHPLLDNTHPPSLTRYYSPASFYEIDVELCTILDNKQLPCPVPCSGRENPLAHLLDQYSNCFRPIRP